MFANLNLAQTTHILSLTHTTLKLDSQQSHAVALFRELSATTYNTYRTEWLSSVGLIIA